MYPQFTLETFSVSISAAVYDDWIFSYDKIPNPIVVACNIFDPTEQDYCSTDVIVPLRVYAEDDNMEMEAEHAMNYWNNR